MIEDAPELHAGLTPEQLAARERAAVPFHVIINPKISPIGDERAWSAYEGCLSFKGFVMSCRGSAALRGRSTRRARHAPVIEATGWYARILQHEIDHLHGKMYIDRMYPRSFTTQDNLMRCMAGTEPCQFRPDAPGE